MSDSDDKGRSREKRHKKEKKKHKKQSKEKKRKKTSRRSSDSSDSDDGSKRRRQEIAVTAMVTPSTSTAAPVDMEDTDMFGPALPPHLLKKNSEKDESIAKVVGPVLPAGISLDQIAAQPPPADDSDDDLDMYGPIPADSKRLESMTTAQIELEQRALELKLAKFDDSSSTSKDQKVREEWMLELPSVGLKNTGIVSLKTAFQAREGPDFSDRSSWTKTPLDKESSVPKKSKDVLKSEAESRYERERDAEQEKIAKKHKKKHKRDESLVEMHQKKLKAEEKKKEKEGKPERRPFSRDVDLKLNKIDKHQTKSIVDKAKILDTRFSSGKAKYL